jgi:hypothetical protein
LLNARAEIAGNLQGAFPLDGRVLQLLDELLHVVLCLPHDLLVLDARALVGSVEDLGDEIG